MGSVNELTGDLINATDPTGRDGLQKCIEGVLIESGLFDEAEAATAAFAIVTEGASLSVAPDTALGPVGVVLARRPSY